MAQFQQITRGGKRVERTRPAWRSYWGSWIIVLAGPLLVFVWTDTAAALVDGFSLDALAAWLVASTAGDRPSAAAADLLARGLLLAPSLFAWLSIAVRRATSAYEIIDKQVIRSERGVISRTQRSITLSPQVHVDLSQTVIERLLAVGTLKFWTGDDRSKAVWAHISRPATVQEYVEGLKRGAGTSAREVRGGTQQDGRPPSDASRNWRMIAEVSEDDAPLTRREKWRRGRNRVQSRGGGLESVFWADNNKIVFGAKRGFEAFKFDCISKKIVDHRFPDDLEPWKGSTSFHSSKVCELDGIVFASNLWYIAALSSGTDLIFAKRNGSNHLVFSGFERSIFTTSLRAGPFRQIDWLGKETDHDIGSALTDTIGGGTIESLPMEWSPIFEQFYFAARVEQSGLRHLVGSYDPRTKQIRHADVPENIVKVLTPARSSRLVAIGASIHTIDRTTMTGLATLGRLEPPIDRQIASVPTSITMCNDGSELVVYRAGENRIYFVDMNTLNLRDSTLMPDVFSAHHSGRDHVVLKMAPDDSHVAICGARIAIVERKNRQIELEVRATSSANDMDLSGCEFSPSGNRFALLHRDKVRIFERK